jgi:DNA (cytosine-5)-methyltransferase 1
LRTTIPVIDVFAGPGGLGEGFASLSGKGAKFDIRLSMEVDGTAFNTLRLRTFFHLSRGTLAQHCYYAFLRGDIDQQELAKQHPTTWAAAGERVQNVELGADGTRLSVHRAIQKAVGGEGFILIGGPPCQAYSIMGRSRRLRKLVRLTKHGLRPRRIQRARIQLGIFGSVRMHQAKPTTTLRGGATID